MEIGICDRYQKKIVRGWSRGEWGKGWGGGVVTEWGLTPVGVTAVAAGPRAPACVRASAPFEKRRAPGRAGDEGGGGGAGASMAMGWERLWGSSRYVHGRALY